MTVRLDPASRRKIERLAAREGISMNEALNRLLRQAPDGSEAPRRRRRYRLKPRRVAFGLAWPTVHQFLRLGTNPAFPGCMSDDEAVGWIEEWLDAGVELVSDADLAWDLLSELVTESSRLLRNSIDDAHLAAIAISRGATLSSFDSDFEAFIAHGLRWEQLTTA